MQELNRKTCEEKLLKGSYNNRLYLLYRTQSIGTPGITKDNMIFVKTHYQPFAKPR